MPSGPARSRLVLPALVAAILAAGCTTAVTLSGDVIPADAARVVSTMESLFGERPIGLCQGATHPLDRRILTVEFPPTRISNRVYYKRTATLASAADHDYNQGFLSRVGTVGEWCYGSDLQIRSCRMYAEHSGPDSIRFHLPDPVSEEEATAIVAFLRNRPAPTLQGRVVAAAVDLEKLSSVESGEPVAGVVAERWYRVWFGGRGFAFYRLDGAIHVHDTVRCFRRS